MLKEKKKLRKKRNVLLNVPAAVDVDPTANMFLAIADYATKRVIAPFVKIQRKDIGFREKKKVSSLVNLIGKKPSIEMTKISQFLSDDVDLTTLLNDTAQCMKSVTDAIGITLWHFVLLFKLKLKKKNPRRSHVHC